jgi:glucose/arabinose dehydrogenase/PKD repeat protein
MQVRALSPLAFGENPTLLDRRREMRRTNIFWRAPITVLARCLLAVLLLVGVFSVVPPAFAAPGSFDPNAVANEFVTGSLTQPISADWFTATRLLLLGKAGEISVVDTTSGSTRTIFTIPGVYSDGEAGALDLVIDPNVASNRTFYVYYAASDTRLRIGRFVLDSATNPTSVVSNTTVWSNPGNPPRSYFPGTAPVYHVGGALDIGPDDKFYLSIGDAEQGLSRSLSNVFGKVLRINLDGTIPADNPFRDGSGGNIDEIWATGFRNPYRMHWDRTRSAGNPVGTPGGFLWVGDVGGNIDLTAEEEVNLVERGRDYGWPACEGPTNPALNPGADCPSGVTGPVHYYPHTNGSGCCQNKAIIGGEIYRGSTFPLNGIYVYVDFTDGEVSWLQLAADGRTKVASGRIASGSLGISWMGVGPDGKIYVLNIYQGTLRRLNYTGGGGNQPPTLTSLSVSPKSGSAPVDTTFSALATDPDGDALTYRWDFGDGSAPSSSRNTTHRYSVGGVYSATLTVTDPTHTVLSDPIKISVGSPPAVAITNPPNGASFGAGQTFVISGAATDVIDGDLGGSSLQWDVKFGHNEHAHPVESETGNQVTVTIPTAGHSFAGDTRFVVSLRATNSLGLTSTTSIELRPIKTSQTIRANIPTTATIDAITENLPFQLDTVAGFETDVSVPESVCVGTTFRAFKSWSDGGARSHVSVSSSADLVATYEDTGVRCAGEQVLGEGTSRPSRYVPVAPTRVFDSRSSETKPKADSTTVVPIGGLAGVPTSDVSAVVLNITATQSADAGFVTAFPSGTAKPDVSNLNLNRVDATTPNLVTVPLGADSAIALYSSTDAHLLVDVVGYYEYVSTAVPAGRFVPVPPTRVVDTRTGDKPAADARLVVPLTGLGGLPAAGVGTVVLNVTGVDATDSGFVTVWSAGSPRPEVSNLNLEAAGDVRSNQVIVRPGTDGSIELYTQSGTHLLVDVVGYFTNDQAPSAPSGLFHSAGPGRVLDTRGGTTPTAGQTVSAPVAGQFEVPVGTAAAVVANVTAVNALEPGYVTVWPSQQPMPETSNLNVADAGLTVPNHAMVQLGADGAISVFTAGSADLIVDIFGWYLA